MPNIVPYSLVTEKMSAAGYRSLYHNSGAFGFGPGVQTLSRGWIGPEDGSIREEARAIVHQAVEPFDETIAAALIKVWQSALVGPMWLMPRSHWSFELQFGHRDWLPEALREIGIDPHRLSPLNNAPAIAFELAETEDAEFFIRQMLNRLISSDFQLAFPDQPILCTLHTRCQLWWTTTRPELISILDAAI
jgi:hypothetical protein